MFGLNSAKFIKTNDIDEFIGDIFAILGNE